MRRTLSAAATLLLTGALAAGLPAAASAENGIALGTTYAAPIAASNALCTAEPKALVYGTTNFNPGQPLTHRSHGYPGISFYEPANAPSSLDLVRANQAGGRSDLCVGFTLPPDVEPQLERDWYNDAPRLQDTPKWSDLDATHVSTWPLPMPSTAVATQGDDLESLSITLPDGYALTFDGAPQCTDAAFAAGSFVAAACPTNTRVGDAFVRISAFTGGGATHKAATGLALYNLTPQAGELGRLGLSLKPDDSLAPIKLQLSVRFAADGSGRLATTLTGAPRSTFDAAAIGKAGDSWSDSVLTPGDPRIGTPKPGSAARTLYLEGMSLRAWGSKANHPGLASDFASAGSRCDAELSAAFSVTTYAGLTSKQTSPSFSLADCSSLDLHATAALTTTSAAAGAPTGATLSVTLPQDGPRAPALATALVAALPDGLELGPQLASGDGGQPLCSDGAFGQRAPHAPSTCPPGSAIGDVRLATPVSSSAFAGALYLTRASDPDAIAGVGADLALPTGDASPPARLKVTGALYAEDDGRVVLTLDDLPDLRLSAVTISLRSGANGVFRNPRTCGTHTGSLTLERASADGSTTPLSIDTTEDCDAPGLSPGLSLASSAGSAGGPATRVVITRPDRAPALERADVTLPPGVLLAPGALPECSDNGADAGSCPADAQLGSVHVVAGSGDHPTTYDGAIYLADGPDGALAGGVIIAQAHVGDVDLGPLVAPVRFDLLGDARMRLSATIPSRVRGVAVDLRSLTLDLDRSGAIRQPTACGELPASVTVSGGGASATATTSLSYASCRGLGFEPTFAATAAGDAKPNGHPRVTVSLTARAGDAALRGAAITFPAGLRLDAARTKAACSLAQWNAAACPGTSQIGEVTATTALATEVGDGDAYLVAVPGELLPAVGVAFDGTYGQRLLGHTKAAAGGRLTVDFSDLPDLPLTKLVIALAGGTGGAVQNTSATACPKTNGWLAELRGQGGQSQRRSTTTGCNPTSAGESPAVSLTLSAKTGLKLKISGFGEQRLQAVKLTLPKAMRIVPGKAKRKGNTQIALIGGTAKAAFTSGSLTLAVKGEPTEVVERLRTKAYRLTGAVKPEARTQRKSAKKAKKATFRLRMTFTDGTVQARTLAVKLP